MPVQRQLRSAEGVDAPAHDVQSTSLDAVMYRVAVEAELQKLRTGNDPMLASSESIDP